MKKGLKEKLYIIIFEADTPTGKLFDVLLLWGIILSVLAVILETVAPIEAQYGDILRIAEWVFTILFSIEYMLRVFCARKPLGYIFSFFGVIDLLSILPTYLSLYFVGTHYLMVIRSIRLLRVFRVLKLARYLGESQELAAALTASRHKIAVFIGTVFIMVTIVGTLFYIIEGPENGYTSIPKGIYWAIVTLTTVGYGDITPKTPIGQALSAIVMILGYGVIAVPTGIVSAEMAKSQYSNQLSCSNCKKNGHENSAMHCKYCGNELS